MPREGFKAPEDIFFTPACLIAIVGLDGAGKTSQAARLVDELVADGVVAELLPNQTQAPMKLILEEIAREEGLDDYLELVPPDVMRLASTIVKVLDFAHILGDNERARSTVLVADRYAVCQYAAARAQGAGNEELLRKVNARLPPPDLTVFLDVAPETALDRILARGLDDEDVDFLHRYRKAYLGLPEAAGFTVVDGEGRPDEVAAVIAAHARTVLRQRGIRP